MIRPYILEENNWKDLKDFRYELAVLPWGATEAHNYHLPYGTDNVEGTAFAAESARIAWDKGAKVVVLPTIPFGVNTGQTDIYLDMNMRPSTQKAILEDILEVLVMVAIIGSRLYANWAWIFRACSYALPNGIWRRKKTSILTSPGTMPEN